MRQQADINKSSFTRTRDDLRDDLAQQIHDLANTNIAQLASYGITFYADYKNARRIVSTGSQTTPPAAPPSGQ